MIATAQARHAELRTMDRRIEAVACEPPLREAVARLRALKGIDTLSAATIASEIGDFAQFPRATSFMAFVGLVPGEHSSGQTERRGSITKDRQRARASRARRGGLYQHRPAVGAVLRRRQEGLPSSLVALSWSAQLRMCAKYRKLIVAKPKTVAVTAVDENSPGSFGP